MFLQLARRVTGYGLGMGLFQRSHQNTPELFFAWQVERSDAQIAAAMRNGILAARCRLRGFERRLDSERGVLHQSHREAPRGCRGGIVARPDEIPVAQRVLSTLDQSLPRLSPAVRATRRTALSMAYIALSLSIFGRVRDPGLVRHGRHFAEFKAAVNAETCEAPAIARAIESVAGDHRAFGGLGYMGRLLSFFLIICGKARGHSVLGAL